MSWIAWVKACFEKAGFQEASAPAGCAHLGNDHEIVPVGMQCLPDDLVGDMRAVEIAGVDMVDAAFHRLAQHRDRLPRRSFGGAEDAFARKLHGTIAKALDHAVAKFEVAGCVEIGHGNTSVSGHEVR